MGEQGRLLDDWITAYLAYTAESEAPDEFHTWVAISTIAGVMRRSCYFDMGYFKVYPNLYTILTSPAGRCKKSTAMRIAQPMLGEVPGINFTVDSVTRERLIQDLTQTYNDGQSAMTAYSSEFASLLTSSGMDMVVFLTDIYDCPFEWTHRTKMGGTNKIKAPYLNLLAATTPDWIAKAMPLDTVGIGLTSRIVFVYSSTPRVRPPFPVLSSEQHELSKLLVQDLIAMSTLAGEYTLEPAAKKFYEEWYFDRRDETKFSDTRLSGYFERKPVHVLKTAMVVSAAQRHDTIMTIRDLQVAFELLGKIEGGMPRVFASVGKNPLAPDIEATLATVLANPDGVLYTQLLDMFKHSIRKDELDEVLDTLRMAGHIKTQQTEHGPKYFPVRKA